jgi:hypothetical protein
MLDLLSIAALAALGITSITAVRESIYNTNIEEYDTDGRPIRTSMVSTTYIIEMIGYSLMAIYG